MEAIFLVIFGTGVVFALAVGVHRGMVDAASIGIALVALTLALVVSNAIKIADQWERAFGKFHTLSGPGLFFIIPIIDRVPYWVDTRVITDSFKAEKTPRSSTPPEASASTE